MEFYVAKTQEWNYNIWRKMFNETILQKLDLHIFTYEIKKMAGTLKAKWGPTTDG